MDSGSPVEELDRHHRVVAGPGAGKTHWLVVQLKHIVDTSRRLTPPARVACISYTNAAGDEIRRRLARQGDCVEVSTIHSFLYRNVVRPYLSRLVDQGGVPLVMNIDRLTGHDEHRPSRRKVSEWIKLRSSTPLRKRYRGDEDRFVDALRRLQWVLERDTRTWQLVPHSSSSALAGLRLGTLRDYKELYWQDGTIDHEDVLFFAHQILSQEPELAALLSARFPYVVLDEFQDTSPVQTDVVRWFAEAGSTVHVVGDPEQSVYSFQGACRADFSAFSLEGQRNCRINVNRRSTNAIVRFLNALRRDGLFQEALRDDEGEPVCIVVGPSPDAVARFRTRIGDEPDCVVLTWRNDEAARLAGVSKAKDGRAWGRLCSADSDRTRWLSAVTKALAAAEATDGRDAPALGAAAAELIRALRDGRGQLRPPLRVPRPAPKPTEIEVRAIAHDLLRYILTQVKSWIGKPVLEAYGDMAQFLTECSPSVRLPEVRKGAFREAAAATAFGDLLSGVLSGHSQAAQTIHSAKGHEYKAVFLWLPEEADIDYVLDPVDRGDDEKGRVLYVGCSRARDTLMLGAPTLCADRRDRAAARGLEVLDAGGERGAPPGQLGLFS